MTREELSGAEVGGLRCPTCAALVAPGAAWCGSCGTPLTSAPQGSGDGRVPPPQTVSHEQAATPPTAVPAPPVASSAAAAATDGASARVCGWCGTPNAGESTTCRACGAAFPRPDLDAAIARDAELRLRAAEEERQQRAARRGLRWLFRA